jgi:starch synthase (maltosyl-transferring)
MWSAIFRIVMHWIDAGVRIFRVDNPHTKPFIFWEWLIAKVRRTDPDVLFLAEAFTRPKIMYHLAKAGFTQSYTYFTWRNTAWEFEQYLIELTTTAPREFYRPNFWTNTPDILAEHLVKGGRPAFAMRTVLATTLSGNWGMYGPAFELMENVPVKEGSEEYLDSEKYEVRHWDLDTEPNVKDLIRTMNRIRREHPALQQTNDITFHPTTNGELLCYSKQSGDDVVLVVVNMSWMYPHSGFLTLDLDALGLDGNGKFTVRDLLDGASYEWEGERNYVELEPKDRPAHVFVIERE